MEDSSEDDSNFITQMSPRRNQRVCEEDVDAAEPSAYFENRKAREIGKEADGDEDTKRAEHVENSEMFKRNRFRKPITSLQCQTFEESWISDASRKKWGWVSNTFEQWRAERNDAISNDSYSDEPLINTSLEEMSDEQLDFFLARFVAEVRNVDGKEYPGKTIYEMLSSIQTYLRVECSTPTFHYTTRVT